MYLQRSKSFDSIEKSLRGRTLFTVCEEAACPNKHECWSGGTATFMILGGVCTRGCRFCSVTTGNPRGVVDPCEPDNTARTISEMNLRYVVITSVDRDDLADQGVGHFVQTVHAAKKRNPGLIVEVLTPDWRGEKKLIEQMAQSGAEVLGTNLETVRRLQGEVRDPRAGYDQTLDVLRLYKAYAPQGVITKSALMLGLGETNEEVLSALQDLRDVGVSVVTLGQYLQPTIHHLPVKRYVHPNEFDRLKAQAEAMGFLYVAAGPFVRSSYKAAEHYLRSVLKHQDGQKGQNSELSEHVPLV